LANSRSLARYELSIRNSILDERNQLYSMLPSVSADYSASMSYLRDWEFINPIDTLNAGATLSITQVIFQGGKSFIQKAISAIATESVRKDAEADDALGQQIRIGTNYFSVIGLLESKGAGFGGNDQDDVVMVPLDTALTRLSNSRNINTIVLSVAGKDYMDAAQKETELILRESRKIADGAASDFDIMNQADMIDMASATSRTLTTLLAAIAGVSLLVGGIGIMNIMLVSVTERTREIGIRMAVGGRKRDILFQFLTESVILSLMGGLLGIGLAFLVCRIMSMAGISTAINPLIVAGSTIFAALIGIVFGYYPALKAARLYPIDALRYE